MTMGKGFQYLDLNFVLGIFFKKFSEFCKNTLWSSSTWNCQSPDGAYTEFNLLKTRKANVAEITKEIKFFSILVPTPPPLDYKRQEYLYHNFRSLVRDEFKDIVQDQPILILAINKIFKLKFSIISTSMNFLLSLILRLIF